MSHAMSFTLSPSLLCLRPGLQDYSTAPRIAQRVNTKQKQDKSKASALKLDDWARASALEDVVVVARRRVSAVHAQHSTALGMALAVACAWARASWTGLCWEQFKRKASATLDGIQWQLSGI